MKIAETVERHCCQTRDFKPLEGTPKKESGRVPEWVFCVHCGRRHRYDAIRDEVGSSYWEYVPTDMPWA